MKQYLTATLHNVSSSEKDIYSYKNGIDYGAL